MSPLTTLTRSKPFYVVAGATDLVVANVRAVPTKLTSVTIDRRDLQRGVAGLSARAVGLPAHLQSTATGIAADVVGRVDDVYGSLLGRGRWVATRIRRQQASRDLSRQLATTVRRTRTIGSVAADSVAQTTAAARAAATAARRTSSSAVSATVAGAEKVGTEPTPTGTVATGAATRKPATRKAAAGTNGTSSTAARKTVTRKTAAGTNGNSSTAARKTTARKTTARKKTARKTAAGTSGNGPTAGRPTAPRTSARS